MMLVDIRSALPTPLPPRSGGEGSGVGGLFSIKEKLTAPHPGALHAPTLPTARKCSRGEGKLCTPNTQMPAAKPKEPVRA
jgi:hypothetical protein